MRGETTFSNEAHIINSTSSGFSTKTACVLYMLLLTFHIYLGFFSILFLFLCRWWFHIAVFTIRSHPLNFIVPNAEDFNLSSDFLR